MGCPNYMSCGGPFRHGKGTKTVVLEHHRIKASGRGTHFRTRFFSVSWKRWSVMGLVLLGSGVVQKKKTAVGVCLQPERIRR